MKVWAPIICVLLLAVACSGSSRDERAAFALEIENLLSRIDARAEGSALLKGAAKKLRGE